MPQNKTTAVLHRTTVIPLSNMKIVLKFCLLHWVALAQVTVQSFRTAMKVWFPKSQVIEWK